jgi:hypothetical protein
MFGIISDDPHASAGHTCVISELLLFLHVLLLDCVVILCTICVCPCACMGQGTAT